MRFSPAARQRNRKDDPPSARTSARAAALPCVPWRAPGAPWRSRSVSRNHHGGSDILRPTPRRSSYRRARRYRQGRERRELGNSPLEPSRRRAVEWDGASCRGGWQGRCASGRNARAGKSDATRGVTERDPKSVTHGKRHAQEVMS